MSQQEADDPFTDAKNFEQFYKELLRQPQHIPPQDIAENWFTETEEIEGPAVVTSVLRGAWRVTIRGEEFILEAGFRGQFFVPHGMNCRSTPGLISGYYFRR